MKLTLGYSPCPNDCFIFDALIHNKIDTEGLEFEVLLEDVETLNNKAFSKELDITKLSYHAYAYAIKDYILLRSGSALGFNCGPLLITTNSNNINANTLNLNPNLKIAIPGKYTTANLLLSIAFPELKNKIEYIFNEIEHAVLTHKVDAGLIIHENRFTYKERGLEKIIDLGEYWESLIHAPIPLGGIVIRRGLDDGLQQQVNRLIRKSVEFAFQNPESCMNYVKKHSQEMSVEVMQKHIALYVNDFSIDLADTGIKAVNLLFNKAKELNLFNYANLKLVID